MTGRWAHLTRSIGAMLGSTSRTRAEAELRESARQLHLERAVLRAVLQQAPIGISITGPGPQPPTMINAYAENLLGHGVGVDGPGDARFAGYGALHLDGRPYLPAEYPSIRALRKGEVVRAEEMASCNARTGEVRRMQVYSAPVRDAEGTTQAAVTVFVDVEEARRAQEELKEAQKFTAALLDLGDRLRDIALVADMFRSAAEVVGLALGVFRAGFGSRDADGAGVTVEADWTDPGQAHAAAHPTVHPGTVWAALGAGQPLIVPDVRADPRTADDAALLLGNGVGAMMCMPVRERGQATMLLFAQARVARAWTAAEREFLRGVVDRVEVGVARLRAEDHQQLLNRELSHRMKNLIAMVQAITVQTMRTACDLSEARDVLSGRLVALSKAHDLLLGGCMSHTRLGAVVRDALRVHQDRPDRFTVCGPDIEVCADPALALALALHELATNAAKYGALRTEGGRVAIDWEVEGGSEPTLRLTWRERGGPPVHPPARAGFGSRFLERALALQVGGEVALAYPETGATFALRAPLSAFGAVP